MLIPILFIHVSCDRKTFQCVPNVTMAYPNLFHAIVLQHGCPYLNSTIISCMNTDVKCHTEIAYCLKGGGVATPSIVVVNAFRREQLKKTSYTKAFRSHILKFVESVPYARYC